MSLTGFRRSPVAASTSPSARRPSSTARSSSADRRSDRGSRGRVAGQPDLRRGQRSRRRARDSGSAAQRPLVSAARAAAAGGAGRAGGRQRRGRRPHAEDFHQRRASGAEQFSARRHRHQQRLQQDARLGGRCAARRRGRPRVPDSHQRVLGGVRPIRGRHLQRRHALGRESLLGVGLRVSSQLRARCAELLRSAVAAQARLHPSSVRRRAGRAAAARSHVLLRRVRGPRGAAGRHRRDRGARRRCATRDPRRPPDRPAPGDPGLSGLAFPARERPLARRRRGRVSVLGHAADRRALLPVARRSPPLGGQQHLRPRHPRSRRRAAHPAEQAADFHHRREDAEHLHHGRIPAHVLARDAESVAHRTEPIGVARQQRADHRHSARTWRGFPANNSATSRSRGWSPKWPATSGCRATIGSTTGR